ncbi:MAG: class II aldolase/adducin family protein [Bradymonadia bacterium]
MTIESSLRRELIQYLKRIDARGWVANHDGNVSCRVSAGRFLATPTGMAKIDITEQDLIVVDIEGTVIRGQKRIFSEWILHRTVYESRPEVNAVVHAHSPFATALGSAGGTLPHPFLPEAVVSLGPQIPSVPLTMPGQPAADALRSALDIGQSCLIEGNGSLAWGRELEQAYLRMELVEHLARIAQLAQPSGGVKRLPEDMITLLVKKHVSAGLAAPSVARNAEGVHTVDLAEKVGRQLAVNAVSLPSDELAAMITAVTSHTLDELKNEK